MKLTTILSFVIIFSLVAVAGASLYNDIAGNYNIALNENISNTYDSIQEYYGDIEEVENQVKGTDSAAADTGDNNFIASIKAMWSSVQLFFGNFGFVLSLSNSVGQDLGIPAVVIQAITGLVLLGLVALIVSIAVRWKVD